jgi:phosphoglycerate-specific signal transduction histidine kinase
MKAWLCNLQMAKKLLVSPVTAILFLLIFGLVSYAGFFRQKAALDDIYNTRFTTCQSTASVIIGLKEVHGNIYKLLSWIGSNYEKARIDAFAEEQFATLKKVTAELEQKGKATNLTKAEKERFASTAGLLTKYQEALHQITGLDVATASMLMTQADDIFQTMSKTLDELLVLENKLSKEQYTSSASIFRVVLIVSAIVLLVAIILPFGLSMLMRAISLRPSQRPWRPLRAFPRVTSRNASTSHRGMR